MHADNELRGRRREQETLDRLLRDVRAGHSRVLVLRGEAGAGKSALLDYLAGQAPAGRVVRVAGVEPETDLAYSALQQLCAPLLEHLDGLPAPQREALATAFGLSAGRTPDALIVGLAVLGLLAEAAAQRPLIVVIDDAQWLDRMSEVILTFVARRLGEESVGLILAARPVSSFEGRPSSFEGSTSPFEGLRSPFEGLRSPFEGLPSPFEGLPELLVDGLAAEDARALLDAVLPGLVDASVRDRIVAETRGNPLALLELPRGLNAAELAFGFGSPAVDGGSALAGRIEEGFQRRIAALPPDTRLLLLTAAVEPVGNVPLLWRALGLLGIGADAAAPAETSGLIEIGTRVRFRHPLVRSAVWRAADPAQLRAVHRALAEVTDPDQDPDRRAWHRGHGTAGLDEEVAAELERSADRALARGGRAAAASFLERAAELTGDSAVRAGRTLAAAHARFASGAVARVPELLAAAELGPLDAVQQAAAERLRARVAFTRNTGRAAIPPLLDAAARLEKLDPAAARETYLSAIGAAVNAGRLGEGSGFRGHGAGGVDGGRGGDLRRVVEAAAALPDGDEPAGRLLAGMISWQRDGIAAAVPLLRHAVGEIPESRDLDLLWLTGMVVHEIWDDTEFLDRTARAVTVARSSGTLSSLPTALTFRATALIYAGRFGDATELLDEAAALAQTTAGPSPHPATAVILAAHQGRAEPALELIRALEVDALAGGAGWLIGVASYSRAVLHNGLGNYPAALAAAREATDFDDLAVLQWGLFELVEAAARTGEHGLAAVARDRLVERTQAAGTAWARGTEALARALAGSVPHLEDHYRSAVEQFAETRLTVQLARAQLVYGEWLRRENRRADAREQLRAAHDAFTTMGATGFADRAGRELLATGETVRKRHSGVREELTSQETQIVRLAAAGRTNPEIGAVLFLSPRTVEWHLRKIFTKLGITSRRELHQTVEMS
ncbi:DNA-binding CsgD family transcriptional regulator/tetratricopeptide (TPR) repeat protein [Actinoplanes lutulentus]|uniref:Regulatory LuxR family protein n=1 Tax=Actinoplanes lutulentus TaxID=1287878 RepID=A0A327ZP20_9ACTN|nr:LuxR family transcriptional regulator [Actinoplanes lutulentus]MBB2940835.1 DNA-binding CsgD family transcriptional regulator/tetratricopeptide (TPR) repeat protein [Actinoplanes lutulentus]RAK43144.1 regulatory LuxR family protein [Actinoplanes lutulentus]